MHNITLRTQSKKVYKLNLLKELQIPSYFPDSQSTINSQSLMSPLSPLEYSLMPRLIKGIPRLNQLYTSHPYPHPQSDHQTEYNYEQFHDQQTTPSEWSFDNSTNSLHSRQSSWNQEQKTTNIRGHSRSVSMSFLDSTGFTYNSGKTSFENGMYFEGGQHLNLANLNLEQVGNVNGDGIVRGSIAGFEVVNGGDKGQNENYNCKF
jgi:hypothetical protein